MSNAQKVTHTPGPWKYEAEKGYVLKCFIMTADFDEDANKGSVIARTSDNISEADARLIAAAPEMLAALERLCKHATECEMCSGEPSQVDGIDWVDIVSARDIIAKARGV